jgi:uncharacterized membrane protein (UPF0127 family)
MIELRVTILKSLKDKSLGLLNSKKAHPISFKTRFGIHTFGMKFPIDVLILNKEGVVIKLRGALKPNRIFIWPPRFDTVIELPSGEISRKGIAVGHAIRLISLK